MFHKTRVGSQLPEQVRSVGGLVRRLRLLATSQRIARDGACEIDIHTLPLDNCTGSEFRADHSATLSENCQVVGHHRHCPVP